MHLPTDCAPAFSSASFAAEVLDGSGHVNGSPSAPLRCRLAVLATRFVGMASTESDKLASTAAAKLSLKGIMNVGFLLGAEN